MNLDREETRYADPAAADRAVQRLEDRGQAVRGGVSVEGTDDLQPHDVMASPTVLTTAQIKGAALWGLTCLLYTSPSPRD